MRGAYVCEGVAAGVQVRGVWGHGCGCPAGGVLAHAVGHFVFEVLPHPPTHPPTTGPHRDHGPRADRQQARLIWLIEEVGLEKWQALIEERMGGVKLRPAVKVRARVLVDEPRVLLRGRAQALGAVPACRLQNGAACPAPTLSQARMHACSHTVHVLCTRACPQAHHEGRWERRDVLGVHDQKQPGMCWVGACVPAGRLQADDFDELARIAEVRACVRVHCAGVHVPAARSGSCA